MMAGRQSAHWFHDTRWRGRTVGLDGDSFGPWGHAATLRDLRVDAEPGLDMAVQRRLAADRDRVVWYDGGRLEWDANRGRHVWRAAAHLDLAPTDA